eukprot:TRINITY_DN15912_c0_g3_i3.p1 TRINITY_DN15912_c0_g3~~TRINITY_DN15912_c0_g3_i3.p1  ORF type:complete len:113 (-),score=11.82 TRINITY_DN15912_c0_g3_i3:1928-2266(-)
MAQAVMLLCKYGMFTSVIHLSESMKYNDLMHRVCNKWKNLAVNMVCLTYALPGHPKCLLDNDLDLLSLSMAWPPKVLAGQRFGFVELVHVGVFNGNGKSGCICIRIAGIKGR